jgi:hypothetical protein
MSKLVATGLDRDQIAERAALKARAVEALSRYTLAPSAVNLGIATLAVREYRRAVGEPVKYGSHIWTIGGDGLLIKFKAVTKGRA